MRNEEKKSKHFNLPVLQNRKKLLTTKTELLKYRMPLYSYTRSVSLSPDALGKGFETAYMYNSSAGQLELWYSYRYFTGNNRTHLE